MGINILRAIKPGDVVEFANGQRRTVVGIRFTPSGANACIVWDHPVRLNQHIAMWSDELAYNWTGSPDGDRNNPWRIKHVYRTTLVGWMREVA